MSYVEYNKLTGEISLICVAVLCVRPYQNSVTYQDMYRIIFFLGKRNGIKVPVNLVNS